MNCRHCGLKIVKNDRFVLVGVYPGRWKRSGYSRFVEGLEYFGELFHEACYLESVGKRKTRQKEGAET